MTIGREDENNDENVPGSTGNSTCNPAGNPIHHNLDDLIVHIIDDEPAYFAHLIGVLEQIKKLNVPLLDIDPEPQIDMLPDNLPLISGESQILSLLTTDSVPDFIPISRCYVDPQPEVFDNTKGTFNQKLINSVHKRNKKYKR